MCDCNIVHEYFLARSLPAITDGSQSADRFLTPHNLPPGHDLFITVTELD